MRNLTQSMRAKRRRLMPSSTKSTPVNVRDLVTIWTDTYRSNLRYRAESASGPGSTMEQTAIIRQEIPVLIQDLQVKTLLDSPCGDTNWISQVDLGVDLYIGADIVDDVVQANKSRSNWVNGFEKVFMQVDITTDKLPQVDLVLCRDCLVHLSYTDIVKALRNFVASGSKYLLTTTYTAPREFGDIQSGDWRPLNLQFPPFSFPPPVRIINEGCTEGFSTLSDKSLGLWQLSDLSL